MKIFRLLTLIALFTPVLFSQVLLEENFDYPVGDSVRAHGWNITGTSTLNPVLVSASGLTYSGYPLTAGNSAALQTTGQDVNKAFNNGDSVTSGNVYASFLVKISAVQATGDYFFHLGYATDNTFVFMGRIYAKLDNGNIAFGVSKSSANATFPAAYTAGNYSLDSTYLIVLKYTFAPDLLDDSVALFINPNLAAPEPTPDLTSSTTSSTANDVSALRTVCLRQGSSANAPTLKVDGIKVSTAWSSIVPVELTGFTAIVSGKNVRLDWTTATETNNKGFYIQMAKKGAEFSDLKYINGHGTTANRNIYTHSVSNLSPAIYEFRLKQIDFDGSVNYSQVVEATILGLNNFALQQNFPNPFNPSTTITFQIAEDADVTLKLFNVMGQEIKTVLNKRMTAGSHSIAVDATDLSAGVYLYQLKAGAYTSTRKLTLVK